MILTGFGMERFSLFFPFFFPLIVWVVWDVNWKDGGLIRKRRGRT